jgi:glutamyl-Q tRNA(Asp) synthetase
MVVRFAPSPTGRLHLGHALSAALNWQAARSGGGRMVLRIEDIDTARCRPAFVDAIVADLRWLGIDWDAYALQSDHAARHAAALDRLHALGVLYPCTCTRAEIAASQSAPHGDTGPVYPGTCRGRTDAPEGAAWRLDVAKALMCSGESRSPGDTSAAALAGLLLSQEHGSFDDVVLARKGLGVAYHLAVVVDDAAAGVTDVIRGRDLEAATPVQMLLQRLLGLPTPRYRHHRLIAGPDGRRLAKRTPGATIADLRDGGVDPQKLRDTLLAGRLPVGFAWLHP